MTIRLQSFIPNGQWLEKQQASILSAATIITGAAFLSGIMGVIRNRVLVAYFYNDPFFPSYWVSFRLPELVFQLLVIGALSAAFIPIFTKYEKHSKESAFKMASTVLNLMLLGFTFFSALIFLFALPLTRLITGEQFPESQIIVSATLTRIMIFAQFFFAISNFLSGTIQSYKRFIIPALSPIAYNLGIILGTVIFQDYLGIYAPAIGVVMGSFLHFALQIPLALKLGFRYYPQIDTSHPGVREMFKLMAPRTLTISISQLQLFMTTYFATHLEASSIVILTLAQSLMTFPIRIFGAPIGQAALPFLSKESNNGDFEMFKKLVIQSIHQISFFAMPASVLLLIMRIPVVRLTLGDPNFPWAATLLTGRVVAILTLSIAAQAIVHILIRSFYALHDTRHPLLAAFVGTVSFFMLSTYSVNLTDWGILGIAAALSVSTIIEMFFLLVYLNKKIKLLRDRAFWVPQLKMLIASFLMAVFLWLPFRIFDQLVFDTTRTVDLIGLTISVGTIGMLTYILFAFILEVKELAIIQKVFETFGGWKKTLSKSTEFVETAGQSDESSI